MDVLLFFFANDPTPGRTLPTLKDEYDQLARLFAPGHSSGEYIIHSIPNATRQDIVDFLHFFKDQLVLFHYSGHADRDALGTEQQMSHAGGIAHLLQLCPKLKLVFLNGCSTQGQVKNLLKKVPGNSSAQGHSDGLQKAVPSVLATSAAVQDDKAKNFSIAFYKSLVSHETLEKAFEFAKGAAQSQAGNLDIPVIRAMSWNKGTERPDKGLWGLFTPEKDDEILDWKLPAQAPSPTAAVPQPYVNGIDSKLVVDVSQGQEEWWDLTSLVQASGLNVSLLKLPHIDKAGVIVLPLPFHQLVDQSKINALGDWVEQGGGLFILGYYAFTHHATNISQLTQKWGVTVDDNVVMPEHIKQLQVHGNVVNANENVAIKVTPSDKHPMLQNVNTLVMNSAATVSIDNRSTKPELVVNTPADSNIWLPEGRVDAYGMRPHIKGYNPGKGPAPVLVAFKQGRGKVLICGTWQIFRDYGDNRQFLTNALEWLRPEGL